LSKTTGKDGKDRPARRPSAPKKPTMPKPGEWGPPVEQAREPGLFDARPAATAAVADEQPAPAREFYVPVVVVDRSAVTPLAGWQRLKHYHYRLEHYAQQAKGMVRVKVADRDPAKVRELTAALRKLADDIERDVLGG
jgi:hypothetical protein